jgi:hypothetical protein
MHMSTRALAITLVLAMLAGCDRSQPDKMSFFVTSVPAGAGGAIGGLAGADAHCQRLAEAAGSTGKTWRAYLSAPAGDATPAVHARNRIGRGPWFNARGVQIAAGLEDLHGPGNQIGRNTALAETGESARFLPHDMLTASNEDGTLADGDSTCRGWKSTVGFAVLGHSDKVGTIGPDANSWNSAHLSEGCTAEAFRGTGGNGLFYCFAVQ